MDKTIDPKSGDRKKLCTCHICHWPVYEGQPTSERFMNGGFTRIHYECSKVRPNIFASGKKYKGTPHPSVAD